MLTAPNVVQYLLKELLSLTEDTVDLGTADWADALCHATTRVRDLYSSLEVTLLLALNAVSVTLVCLCHDCLQSASPRLVWLRVLVETVLRPTLK